MVHYHLVETKKNWVSPAFKHLTHLAVAYHARTNDQIGKGSRIRDKHFLGHRHSLQVAEPFGHNTSTLRYLCRIRIQLQMALIMTP